MILVMVTRKVDRNEHLAGFIYNWVKKLGEQVDELRVISWQEGDSTGLPKNIKVTHLKTKQNKLVKAIVFRRAVKNNLKGADGIFCHQMPIYTILAAPYARRYKKKLVSWYMHKTVDRKMKKMEKGSDVVLSASKDSFRLDSNKLILTGHGIDIEKFKPLSNLKATNVFRIVSVGRISPTKDYESMIKAMDILVDSGLSDLTLTIIGEPGLENQKTYFENLKQMVSKMNLTAKVWFLGSVPNNEISHHLQQSDLFLNLSGTGSVDKAVLEAMACECIPLTSNEA